MNGALWLDRRNAFDRLDAKPDYDEAQWNELAERWYEGDLADTRYGITTRDMAWWLMCNGGVLFTDEPKGDVLKQLESAARYAGIWYKLERTENGDWRAVRAGDRPTPHSYTV